VNLHGAATPSGARVNKDFIGFILVNKCREVVNPLRDHGHSPRFRSIHPSVGCHDNRVLLHLASINENTIYFFRALGLVEEKSLQVHCSATRNGKTGFFIVTS
jgi:hypothetical protein